MVAKRVAKQENLTNGFRVGKCPDIFLFYI